MKYTVIIIALLLGSGVRVTDVTVDNCQIGIQNVGDNNDLLHYRVKTLGDVNSIGLDIAAGTGFFLAHFSIHHQGVGFLLEAASQQSVLKYGSMDDSKGVGNQVVSGWIQNGSHDNSVVNVHFGDPQAPPEIKAKYAWDENLNCDNNRWSEDHGLSEVGRRACPYHAPAH